MSEDLQSQPPDKRGWLNLSSRYWWWGVKFLAILLFFLIFTAISPFFDIKIRHQKPLSAELAIFVQENYSSSLLSSFQENTLLSISEISAPEIKNPIEKIYVVVTAYSSTPCQTDDTPFITASGSWVRPGIVAANFLPFGTKITIPEIYGDKVFVVEDRMHARNHYNVDIWFPSYAEAKNFGAIITQVEILEN